VLFTKGKSSIEMEGGANIGKKNEPNDLESGK
jgi:hypothetical protein